MLCFLAVLAGLEGPKCTFCAFFPPGILVEQVWSENQMLFLQSSQDYSCLKPRLQDVALDSLVFCGVFFSFVFGGGGGSGMALVILTTCKF